MRLWLILSITALALIGGLIAVITTTNTTAVLTTPTNGTCRPCHSSPPTRTQT